MNNLPQSMNYIQIEKHGGPEVLKPTFDANTGTRPR